MRFERKYRITGLQFEQIVHLVMSNPAAFCESYPDRYVNSVYYDTEDYRFYHENVQGVSQRIKYRVRWYGEDMYEIRKPIIEKKIKSNMLGTKEYVDLPTSLDADAETFRNLGFFVERDLKPVALVRYRRSYLESFDRMIRATIDRELRYYPMDMRLNQGDAILDDGLILEIKYDEKDAEAVDYCLQALPFRLTKNSKYVSAFESAMLI